MQDRELSLSLVNFMREYSILISIWNKNSFNKYSINLAFLIKCNRL